MYVGSVAVTDSVVEYRLHKYRVILKGALDVPLFTDGYYGKEET